MSKRKFFQDKIKDFILQIIMLSILSLSILCMPFCDYLSKIYNNDIPLYINATLFWIGLIGEVVTSLRLCKRLRNSSFVKKGLNKRLGIVCFFQNREAVVADSIMIISFIGFVTSCICWPTLQILGFFLLALFVFSFGMHWILNGSNYLYIKERKRGKSNV